MSYGDRRHEFGIVSPRAPWRRAARPLAVLFSLQLSGIGCAARAPEIAPPTQPNEVRPYLKTYEAQLEKDGITLEGATDYLAGRRDSPAPGEPSLNGTPTDPGDLQALSSTQQPGEATFKLVDGVAEYRVGPGDLLLVTTFLGPEPALPTSLRVQADGTIFIPRFNIGTIQAAGNTPTELTRELTGRYRQYVPGGYAEVRIEEPTAWHAILTGEIVNEQGAGPGVYVIDGRVTVSDFIYKYGGPTANADLGDVRILRAGQQQRVDVAAVLAGTVADTPVMANDIVFVPSIAQGSSRMFIYGEVGQPGVYTYSEGISVLDAIAQAGGYTQAAKRDGVFVSRPGGVIPVNIDLLLTEGQTATAPLLQPGDFVVVPFVPDRSQKIQNWVGIFSLILSALTIIELTRRN